MYETLSVARLKKQNYPLSNDPQSNIASLRRIELLILPCAVFALFLNERLETLQSLWTFGSLLEAVAIVPQVYLVSKSKLVDSIVVSYVACLGLYRGCYLTHWLYAHLGRQERLARVEVASSIVQLVLYCDFFARNLPIMKQKDRAAGLYVVGNGPGKRPVAALQIVVDREKPLEEPVVVRPVAEEAKGRGVTPLVAVTMHEGLATVEEKVCVFLQSMS